MKTLTNTFITILFAIVVFYVTTIIVDKQFSEITNWAIDRNKKQLEEKRKKKAEIKAAEEHKILTEQLKQQEAIQKERAWDAYYIPPKECDSFESEKEMVECGNHAIRAKRVFNTLWESGQISK